MTSKTFRPLGTRYLVLPDPSKGEEETIGEYTLTRAASVHNKSTTGTVVRCGLATSLSEGARVYFGQYSGYEQKLADGTFVVLQESELLGQDVSDDSLQDELPLTLGSLV